MKKQYNEIDEHGIVVDRIVSDKEHKPKGKHTVRANNAVAKGDKWDGKRFLRKLKKNA